MKIESEEYRVLPETKVRLDKLPTKLKPVCKSKEDYRELLEKHVESLSTLQQLHYASNRYALLLIFQGIDAAGKDGAIRHVMSGVNPPGCEVSSFKQPSAEELEHDFLWRTTRRLPERGRIGIFNRSYYEEVLVVRVHPETTARSKGLSEELRDKKTIWQERYRSIVDMERHLYRNRTSIVKVFLRLSKGEQRKRFLERIDDPDKNWKFSLADIHERKFWKQYMEAYEDCLSATSTQHSPWYVVPADDKENARLIVSQIVLDSLQELKMAYPKTTRKRRRGIGIYSRASREIGGRAMASQSGKVAAPPGSGLTSEEARQPAREVRPKCSARHVAASLSRALAKFWAPVPWMLEAAIVLEIVLGKYVEAAIIALLLIFNAALGFFQEGRAQATLAALKSRLALNASVRRDNVWATVPATGLVPGDVVKLSLGAVVAADVR